MLNSILQHKLIAGIGTIVVLGGLWYGLTGSAAPSPILQTENATNNGDQELVTTLLTLRAVTLNGTIFSDPVFQSLQDFGVEITPEPVGRLNPFAPLAPTAAPTDQTTKSANIFSPRANK